jgi:hypothetical protein
MDALRVKAQIEKFLAGKYTKAVDNFCLYQWLERCAYHKWADLGINLHKYIQQEQFEKSYQDRIQFLARELHRHLSERPKVSGLSELIKQKPRNRRPRGRITNSTIFRSFIIETLIDLGGSGRTKTIARTVEQKMKDILNEEDYTIRASDGQPVWYNTMNWERHHMIKDGILKKNPSWGVWQLGEKFVR